MTIWSTRQRPLSRVERLRKLIDEVEQLEPSPAQLALLRQLRGRLVDVDTGVETRSLKPKRGLEPELEIDGLGFGWSDETSLLLHSKPPEDE